jgi:ATP-dependent Clp protease ATP-binding subunit ClpA
MTHDRDFKRLVRHRMRKTGESYVSARAHLMRPHATSPTASERPGEAAMYPFERFTDPAKRALTRAQFEAEAGHSRSIDTTHLLLGLVHDKNTMAAAMLGMLAFRPSRMREAIARQTAEGPAQESDGLIPSEPVRRAIEFAFAEARLIGGGGVGTGHLLVGVLRTETSSGARALEVLGFNVDRGRASLRRWIASGAVAESNTPQPLPSDRDLREWIEAAEMLARSERSASVRVDHLVRAAPQSRVATELFGRLGLDLSIALAAVPAPPPQLVEVEASVAEFGADRLRGGREPGDRPGEPERRGRSEWERIHREWMQSWGSSAGRH